MEAPSSRLPLRPSAAATHPIEEVEVTAKDTDSDWGVTLTVQFTDGTTAEARPVFPGASYHRIRVGDTVLALLPLGNRTQALVISGPAQSDQNAGDGWDGNTHEERDLPAYYRSASTDSVDGVLTRALLDDLRTHVEDVRALSAAIVQTAIEAQAVVTSAPGTGPQAAAAVIALAQAVAGLSSSAASLAASAQAMKLRIDTAKAGEGQAPFVSTDLKVQVHT